MANYHERGSHGKVVQALGEEILSGELPPETTLDLEELASRFGVSRTVVREVIKVLAGKGLIDARPRRGTFVRPQAEWNRLDPDVLRWSFESSDDDRLFEHLHELREMIEPASARRAAERRIGTDIEAAAEALSRMGRALALGDSAAFVKSDVEFHSALLAAGKNDLVTGFSVIIELGLHVRDERVHADWLPSRKEVARHRRVLDAVIARDPDEAERAMALLLANARRELPRAGRPRQ